jgi:hypothetical protein
VTTGPASLTMRWTGSDVSPRPQGFTGMEDVNKLYTFSITGRDLSGTVVLRSDARACHTPAGTVPSQGRISSDWQTITIIDNHPEITFVPCGWSAPVERVRVFTRDR